MSTYLVRGIKFAQGNTSAVSASAATLTIDENAAHSGFSFTYDTPVRTTALTSATLNTLGTDFTLQGKDVAADFSVSIGSTFWQGQQVQLMKLVDRATGDTYYFQLQGAPGGTDITGTSNWLSLINGAHAFGPSGYSEGSVIYPGQFANDTLSGAGADVSEKLVLTAHDDTVFVGGGNDTVFGGLGNDTVRAGSGHDQINGGEGNDTLILDTSVRATSGAFLDGNALFGGKGFDTVAFDLAGVTSEAVISIDLKLGFARLAGLGHTASSLQSIEQFKITGAVAARHDINVIGSDTGNWIDLTGSKFGKITLVSGSGADVIKGLDGNGTVDAGSGNDLIEVVAGVHKILAGSGNDKVTNLGAAEMTVDGGTGNDMIRGGTGTDKIMGSNGDDSLYGGEGNDSVYGGVGGDLIKGDAGNDALFGSEGSDSIFGVSGQDTIFGGTGDDFIYGGAGNLVDIFGGDGKDTIFSGGQATRPAPAPEPVLGEGMYGGNGNDVLTGDWGRNVFDGGKGYDIMQGFVRENGVKIGDGARDTFILSGPEKGGPIGISDTVTYFEVGIDKLDLSDLGVAMRLSSGTFRDNGLAQMHYNAHSALLQVDLDGDGIQDWAAEVYTVGQMQLTNNDFIF